MEAILSPEEQHSRSHEELMAGLVVSRSRKTRDPSTFLKWSVAPPSHSPNILTPPPTVTNTANIATIAITNSTTNSNVNSNWGLPRSASLPTRFNVEQDYTSRAPANRVLAPPPLHKKKSYPEQVGALNYGPVFEEDQPRARAARKFTKCDKLNEPTRKPEKKLTSKTNVQHELWRTSSSPISTGSGNRGGLARHGSGSVQACNTSEDEKYAGPAYSKSPPPCSLPFPRFSAHQPARTFSSNIADHTSSTATLQGGRSSSSSSSSSSESPSKQVSCNRWDTSFATRDLKRILNLDQQVAT